MEETRKLSEALSRIQYDSLPEETIQMAKLCILDWLGCSIRGWQQPSSQIMWSVISEEGGNHQATIFNGQEKQESISILNAALLNGVASHALDFDDLHNASIIHLGTVVIPAAWALAEGKGKTGRDLLAATVVGYEAGARIGEAINPESYHFWHTTGIAGIFGAAAAAGHLLKLNADQMVACLGTAGTQAAGLWEFLIDGAMSKTLHTGKAAWGGVLAAQVTEKGFTGAKKILEGEKGFCLAVSSNPHWEAITENLGTGYKIDENSFKPYACCKHCHPAIYAGQLLRERIGVKLSEIKSIEILTNEVADGLVNNCEPRNTYGCKFSIYYCLAGMLKFGRLGVDEFSQEAMEDQEIRELMKKITVHIDSKLNDEFKKQPERWSVKVSLQDIKGNTYEQFVEYPKGDPPNPLTWEEGVEKFLNLVTPVYGKEKGEKLADFIEKMDRCDNLHEALAECLK